MRYSGINILIVFLLFICYPTLAQLPEGYYASANGKNGSTLKTSLFNIVKNPKVISYSQLWEAFEKTDARKYNRVWDMYSDKPEGEANYYYDFRTNRCGSYRKEGDCYNREHSLPRKWFGKTPSLETDLFHLYPTDGYVNNRRGNLPLGEVGIIQWESSNGSKVGQNTFGRYTKTVFEPIDEYKGDFARTYFYAVTAYEDQVANWESDQVGREPYPGFSDWSLALLLKWHREDPVSIKEVMRNEEVYKIQGNRNPFIDYPELVEHVWGHRVSLPFSLDDTMDSYLRVKCSPFERVLDQVMQYLNRYFK